MAGLKRLLLPFFKAQRSICIISNAALEAAESWCFSGCGRCRRRLLESKSSPVDGLYSMACFCVIVSSLVMCMNWRVARYSRLKTA